jgi:hypothetical protein
MVLLFAKIISLAILPSQATQMLIQSPSRKQAVVKGIGKSSDLFANRN